MRCPKCGSENVQYVTTTESKGLSASQGCCGWIIFGPIGLLCSFCGSGSTTREYWVCNDCGTKFQQGEEYHEKVIKPEDMVEIPISEKLEQDYHKTKEAYNEAEQAYDKARNEYIKSHKVLKILDEVFFITVLLGIGIAFLCMITLYDIIASLVLGAILPATFWIVFRIGYSISLMMNKEDKKNLKDLKRDKKHKGHAYLPNWIKYINISSKNEKARKLREEYEQQQKRKNGGQ